MGVKTPLHMTERKSDMHKSEIDKRKWSERMRVRAGSEMACKNPLCEFTSGRA